MAKKPKAKAAKTGPSPKSDNQLEAEAVQAKAPAGAPAEVPAEDVTDG